MRTQSGSEVVNQDRRPFLNTVAMAIAAAVAAGTVLVLDPRGFGESDKPAQGYDLDTAARDLHGFLEATNLATSGGIDIIAHDAGTWIAHAHAVNYPADVKRLAGLITGCGHFLPEECPDELIEAVVRFWQSRPRTQ
jgi:pimeloyl-ACP methyl ester carboxylesterase